MKEKFHKPLWPYSKRQVKPTFKQFTESVYHLNYYLNLLNEFHLTLDEVLASKDASQTYRTVCRISIQWVTILIFCSVEDEISKFLYAYKGGSSELQNRIKEFKKMTKPIWDEIKEWEHIRIFRNHALAHNLRDNRKGFESVFNGKQLNEYDIPNSFKELLVFIKGLQILLMLATEVFAPELEEAKIALNKEARPSSRRPNEQMIESWNNAITEANKAIMRYNNNKKDTA